MRPLARCVRLIVYMSKFKAQVIIVVDGIYVDAYLLIQAIRDSERSQQRAIIHGVSKNVVAKFLQWPYQLLTD